MLKTELAAHCLRILEEKMASIQDDLDELIHSIQGESKSSAGDKHETARAMMNIEQEKLGRQLEEVLKMQDSLQQIDFGRVSDKVIAGSLIFTDKGIFLLSIPLGKIVFEEKEIILLSPGSPLGKAILNAGKGQKVEINKTSYFIKSIL